MTTEELLRPRYKVIADWPGRSSNNLSQMKVGYIAVIDKECRHPATNELLLGSLVWESENKMKAVNEKFFQNYPHLFKKLEWWEDRLPEDMPQYVKDVSRPGMNDEIFVYKVRRHFKRDLTAIEDRVKIIVDKKYWVDENDFSHVYLHYTPATEQEYLTMEENKK